MSYPTGATGWARVNPRSPRAFGVCDRCYQRWNHERLTWQWDWRGKALQNLRILVCPRCLDEAQPQLRAFAAPPDPLPIPNARNDFWDTPSYQGFTFYNLGLPSVTPGFQIGVSGIGQAAIEGAAPPGAAGFRIGISGIGEDAIGIFPYANATYATWPIEKDQVLQSAAEASGIPTPDDIGDQSIVVSPVNTPQLLLDANPSRTWLLIYSPVVASSAISLGTATWGSYSNLMLGPGVAYFWADAQGGTPVYQGAITGNALFPGTPIWAWESPANTSVGTLSNDGGVLTIYPASGFPLSASGLAPGDLWSNGGVVTVVGPTSPNPLAPAVYFGSVNANELLLLGGANLPLTPGPPGSGVLWNSGGEVWVS